MSNPASSLGPNPDRVPPMTLAVTAKHKLLTLSPVVVVLTLAGCLLFGISNRWSRWEASARVQKTDDAQVKADVTPLSTKSSGIVAVVAVSDYQHVKAGDLLVQLKDDDFRAQVELAEAAVAASEAALVNLKSQRALQGSRIAAARANWEAAMPDVERTQRELTREQTLEEARVSTQQRLEIATADHQRLVATLAGRKAELDAQLKQLAVFDTQEAQLHADVSAKRASLKLAQVGLDYTRIVAPSDGIVGERRVRSGQLVSAGTQVLSIVGTRSWIVANYNEAQLANVKVGARARILVDGIPDAEFQGRVEAISPASGSVFSLLPPDNATGNFTKIAQRIPVNIVFEDRALDERLRPGMSVTVSVWTGS
ncbi:MAG TPA: HlyD family secretion protein [Polyangiaceae bacterium]|jgi:membrane fusion protein (multidrug efflux system)|nr:HlyD family secretion protein [Polyangiaceae bacterium]